MFFRKRDKVVLTLTPKEARYARSILLRWHNKLLNAGKPTEDVEELIREADIRGMGCMFDMVFNHTSTEHIWFQEALKGNSKYKNYYFFKKGKNGNLPTNWDSKFGGKAWKYVPEFDEYYLHLYDEKQADLNWENEEVRNELIFPCIVFFTEGLCCSSSHFFIEDIISFIFNKHKCR